jgi:hypothetical protein
MPFRFDPVSGVGVEQQHEVAVTAVRLAALPPCAGYPGERCSVSTRAKIL